MTPNPLLDFSGLPRFDAISNVVNRIILMDNIGDGEIYSMRMILETASCRLAAAHASAAGVGNLRSILAEMRGKN